MPSLDLLFTILGTIFTHHEKVLPLPSLPPDGSDPAAADPNGAYCVNLETGANNSQVPPERQQEIMNQTQEEQYQFHQTADAPGTFRATNPDHNFQFTHSADRLTLTPTFNDTTKTVEFQDPAGRTLLGYRDLHVYDRTGRELSSAMALDTSGLTPSITLQTDVHDALFPITIDPFTYMQEGVQQMPNDLSPGDGFGSSSAECGDYFVVGAPLQGNGAAYVYKRTPGTDDFVQVGKLEVPVGENPGTEDQFSSSLAFVEDEKTGIKYLIVGAQQHNGCGSAFVYYLAGAVWTFLQRLQPADLTLGAYFACSIAVYGTMIAIGALAQDGKGAVYIFTLTLLLAVAAFALYQKVIDFLGSVGDDFGFDVDLFGLTLIVGTPGKDAQSGMTTYDRAGAALVFKAAVIGGLFVYPQRHLPDPPPHQPHHPQCRPLHRIRFQPEHRHLVCPRHRPPRRHPHLPRPPLRHLTECPPHLHGPRPRPSHQPTLLSSSATAAKNPSLPTPPPQNTPSPGSSAHSLSSDPRPDPPSTPRRPADT